MEKFKQTMSSPDNRAELQPQITRRHINRRQLLKGMVVAAAVVGAGRGTSIVMEALSKSSAVSSDDGIDSTGQPTRWIRRILTPTPKADKPVTPAALATAGKTEPAVVSPAIQSVVAPVIEQAPTAAVEDDMADTVTAEAYFDNEGLTKAGYKPFLPENFVNRGIICKHRVVQKTPKAPVDTFTEEILKEVAQLFGSGSAEAAPQEKMDPEDAQKSLDCVLPVDKVTGVFSKVLKDPDDPKQERVIKSWTADPTKWTVDDFVIKAPMKDPENKGQDIKTQLIPQAKEVARKAGIIWTQDQVNNLQTQLNALLAGPIPTTFKPLDNKIRAFFAAILDDKAEVQRRREPRVDFPKGELNIHWSGEELTAVFDRASNNIILFFTNCVNVVTIRLRPEVPAALTVTPTTKPATATSTPSPTPTAPKEEKKPKEEEKTPTNTPQPPVTPTPKFVTPTPVPPQKPTEIPATPTPRVVTATPVPTLPPEFKTPTPVPPQKPTEIPFTPTPKIVTPTPDIPPTPTPRVVTATPDIPSTPTPKIVAALPTPVPTLPSAFKTPTPVGPSK